MVTLEVGRNGSEGQRALSAIKSDCVFEDTVLSFIFLLISRESKISSSLNNLLSIDCYSTWSEFSVGDSRPERHFNSFKTHSSIQLNSSISSKFTQNDSWIRSNWIAWRLRTALAQHLKILKSIGLKSGDASDAFRWADEIRQFRDTPFLNDWNLKDWSWQQKHMFFKK